MPKLRSWHLWWHTVREKLELMLPVIISEHQESRQQAEWKPFGTDPKVEVQLYPEDGTIDVRIYGVISVRQNTIL